MKNKKNQHSTKEDELIKKLEKAKRNIIKGIENTDDTMNALDEMAISFQKRIESNLRRSYHTKIGVSFATYIIAIGLFIGAFWYSPLLFAGLMMFFCATRFELEAKIDKVEADGYMRATGIIARMMDLRIRMGRKLQEHKKTKKS